jgi:DNA-binding transcriptional LysR family regulator
MDWGDLRLVLAIGESGSLSGAGRRLSVSHATIFRRLNALEARLGVRLFERSRTGYSATSAGEELIKAAAEVGEIVMAAERRVMGRDLRPSGTVRITTTDTLLCGLLTPICAAFRRSYPEITLELVASNQLFDLTKREADIALRPTSRPSERLVGRKVGEIAHCVYATAADRPVPGWSETEWVASDSSVYFPALEKWMSDNGVDRRVVYRADTFLGLREAVRAGLGFAVLPCYLCDRDPTFRRVSDPIPELETELWLLTHPDMRRAARIRAFMEFAADAIRKERRLLKGTGPAPGTNSPGDKAPDDR